MRMFAVSVLAFALAISGCKRTPSSKSVVKDDDKPAAHVESPTEGDRIQSGMRIRALLAAMILASAVEPAADRPRAMRTALKSNWATVVELVQAPDPLDMIEAAQLPAEMPQEVQLLRELKALAPVRQNLHPPRGLVDAIPDVVFQPLAQAVNDRVAHFQFSKSPALQQILDSDNGIDLKDPTLLKMVQDTLPRYYDALPEESKRRIVVGILQLPPNAAPADQAGALMQKSNAMVQKLYQLVGKQVKSPDLARAMLKVQDGVEPFPWDIAKSQIEARFGPLERAFASVRETPIAAGTIGQVYLATKHDGTEVIIKVRRPGLTEAIEADVVTLTSVTEDPVIKDIIQKLGHTIHTEASFLAEAENLHEGEVYIDPAHGLSIARLDTSFEAFDDVLVIEKATGQPLRAMSDTDLQKQGEAVSSLVIKFFRESMFNSGFFHGDLHPGNLFLELNETSLGYTLTVIDFGNAHHLSIPERQSFLILAAAVAARTPEKAIDALHGIAQIPDETNTVVHEEITKIIASDASITQRIGDVFKALMDAHVTLPEPLISYQRARMFLENQLGEINEALDKADPGHKLKRFLPDQIYRNTTIKDVLTTVPWPGKTLSPSVFFSLAGSACIMVKNKAIGR